MIKQFICRSFVLFALCIVVTSQSLRHVEIFSTNNAGVFEVAVVNSTGLVYTCGTAFGGDVGVFDPNTNSIVANIRPNILNGFTGCPSGVARVNQSTNLIYIAGASMFVIDARPASPTFNTALPSITFPDQTIASFALNTVTNRLFVTTRVTGSNPIQANVQVIDMDPTSPNFHQILATLPLPAGQQVANIAANSATNKVYVATSSAGGGVFLLDGVTNTLSPTRITGTQPSASIAINQTSNTIYASRSDTNSIQAINGATNTFTQNIPIVAFSTGTLGQNIAVNQQTERVYFSLSDGSLAVIDAKPTNGTFNTVIATIANAGGTEIAIHEPTNKLVSAPSNLRSSIVDLSTNTIVATTLGNLSSTSVAIHPATSRAFVGYQLGQVQRIDLTNNSFLNTTVSVELSEGTVNTSNNSFHFVANESQTRAAYLSSNDTLTYMPGLPHGLGRYLFSARNSVTNRHYFVNTSSNLAGTAASPFNGFVAVVDGNSNSIVANVEINAQPFGNPVVNEVTNKVYFPSAGWGTSNPSTIKVLDGQTNTVTNVNTSAFPTNTSYFRSMAVNPTTNKIYFQISDGSSLGVIDGATGVATPLSVAGGVFGLAVNKTLNRVYLRRNSSLQVLNGNDNSIVADIPVPSISNFVVSEASGKIYLTSNVNSNITVVDGNTNSVISTISLPRAPFGAIAIDETRERVYIGAIGTDPLDADASFVQFFNGNTMTLASELSIPVRPSYLVVNPTTKTLYVTSANGFERTGIAVISDPVQPAARAIADFDGDAKSDLSVFRPSDGVWYWRNSSKGDFRGAQFGVSTDVIVPGDYDGDGKTDRAIFRLGTGQWWIDRSNGSGVIVFNFGLATDVPVPGDYDGDGRTDIAIFRPSTGQWWINGTLSGISVLNFGVASDRPVHADYDGDGKTDVAVFRPSTGQWYLLRSLSGILVVNWGAADDVTIPGDFDGDGRSDVAVFRPSNGVWYIVGSTSGIRIEQWGSNSDIPTPGDFDGDGRSDVAVFRPSDGVWYIKNSSNSQISTFNYGLSGDRPVARGYFASN